MTREEQLKFCKICMNQKHDFQFGIICNLTNQKAAFEESCSSFIQDDKLKEELEIAQVENELISKEASKGKRFLNYILDRIFFFVFAFIFGILLGIIIAFIAPSLSWIYETENMLIEYALGFVIIMIYYVTLEATTGRSIAKFITKTKVVDENGEQPNFNTILLRSLCRFIPFEAFSFLGSENTGWHDRLSKTRVIEI